MSSGKIKKNILKINKEYLKKCNSLLCKDLDKLNKQELTKSQNKIKKENEKYMKKVNKLFGKYYKKI